jgi:periplasmic protein TonB
MITIKPAKKKNDITSAVCLSALIHFTAGALLLFAMSDRLITPPYLNGMNFIWVSTDIGGKKDMATAARSERRRPIAKTEESKPADAEKTIYRMATSQTITASEQTPAIVTAKYDASAAGTNQHLLNINGAPANRSAGNTSGIDTLIAYPLYKENSPPVYPEVARVRGYEGIVLVSAEILPNGRVGNAKIRKSSGYAILDQSAIEAVKPWKFEPAKKGGSPFTVWVDLPIKFILHSDTSRS